jgi:hypothetical protein
MVRTIEVKARESDADFKIHEGEWFDTKGLQILDEDVDVYALSHPDDVAAGKPARKLLAKLRKKAISKDIVQIGWDAFRLLAIPSRNRGAAAGPIDTKGIYWTAREPVAIDKWSAQYMQKDESGKKVISKMRVNNVVASGVIGYYEKTPFLGQPCRMTGYTRSGLKQFIHGIPFLRAIDEQFKKLVPEAHKKQLTEVSKKPMYQIDNTAFSTLTVNANFRTALHKDAGDYQEGFGNLSVIEWGRYHGGETLFPRFGIGFNIRTGDFVAMDVHEWHTNAPITTTKEDDAFNKSLPDIRTRDKATGVIGSQELYQRVSFVCYFREKISNCKEQETRDYYKKIDFDLRGHMTKARHALVESLVLPGITGTVERALEQFKIKGTRGTRRRRAQTEKLRKRQHFV